MFSPCPWFEDWLRLSDLQRSAGQMRPLPVFRCKKSEMRQTALIQKLIQALDAAARLDEDAPIAPEMRTLIETETLDPLCNLPPKVALKLLLSMEGITDAGIADVRCRLLPAEHATVMNEWREFQLAEAALDNASLLPAYRNRPLTPVSYLNTVNIRAGAAWSIKGLSSTLLNETPANGGQNFHGPAEGL